MLWKVICLIFLSLSSSLALGDENDIPLTKPIILMGDSQEHERHGTFTYIAGRTADAASGGVAARSPQQDFYVKYSMIDVIKKHILSRDLNDINAAEFAIHLGDFLDISCQSEWDRFLNVSKDYITDGKMILGVGNHDGFYVGNFAFKDMKKRPDLFKRYIGGSSWRDRCNAGIGANDLDVAQNIMHKGKLVKKIVELLGKYPQEMSQDNCEKNMHCGILKASDSWTLYYKYPAKLDSATVENGDLEKQGDYWKSYLVSEVKLPSVVDSADIRIIILDTSQTSKEIDEITALKDKKSGILRGEIQPDQRNLINKLLSNPCDMASTDCLRILAGHHPLTDYLKGSTGYVDDSRKWIVKKLLETNSSQKNIPKVLNLYISAHTHGGYFKKIKIKIDDKKYIYINELNVGAIIENNPHYRTFMISKSKDSGRYFANSKSYLLVNEYNDSCSPTKNDWKFFKDFADRNVFEPTIMGDPHSVTSVPDLQGYLDKLPYLEQSRLEFLQAFKRLEYAKNKGNQIAIELWNEPGLQTINEKMNEWSANSKDPSAFTDKCRTYKELQNTPQTNYWNEEKYKSIEGVIELLNNMKKVTLDLKGMDSEGKNCGGRDAKSNYYLAHTEARFLSLLQDWFESIDSEAFKINGDINQSDYRIYSARCAATIERQNSKSKYPSDQSVNEQRMDVSP